MVQSFEPVQQNINKSNQSHSSYWICSLKEPLLDACGILPLLKAVYNGKRIYRKVSKFWDAKKLCCNLPKIETKQPNLRVFHQKDANGIANSEDPDQTAPLGAV